MANSLGVKPVVNVQPQSTVSSGVFSPLPGFLRGQCVQGERYTPIGPSSPQTYSGGGGGGAAAPTDGSVSPPSENHTPAAAPKPPDSTVPLRAPDYTTTRTVPYTAWQDQYGKWHEQKKGEWRPPNAVLVIATTAEETTYHWVPIGSETSFKEGSFRFNSEGMAIKGVELPKVLANFKEPSSIALGVAQERFQMSFMPEARYEIYAGGFKSQVLAPSSTTTTPTTTVFAPEGANQLQTTAAQLQNVRMQGLTGQRPALLGQRWFSEIGAGGLQLAAMPFQIFGTGIADMAAYSSKYTIFGGMAGAGGHLIANMMGGGVAYGARVLSGRESLIEAGTVLVTGPKLIGKGLSKLPSSPIRFQTYKVGGTTVWGGITLFERGGIGLEPITAESPLGLKIGTPNVKARFSEAAGERTISFSEVEIQKSIETPFHYRVYSKAMGEGILKTEYQLEKPIAYQRSAFISKELISETKTSEPVLLDIFKQESRPTTWKQVGSTFKTEAFIPELVRKGTRSRMEWYGSSIIKTQVPKDLGKAIEVGDVDTYLKQGISFRPKETSEYVASRVLTKTREVAKEQGINAQFRLQKETTLIERTKEGEFAHMYDIHYLGQEMPAGSQPLPSVVYGFKLWQKPEVIQGVEQMRLSEHSITQLAEVTGTWAKKTPEGLVEIRTGPRSDRIAKIYQRRNIELQALYNSRYLKNPKAFSKAMLGISEWRKQVEAKYPEITFDWSGEGIGITEKKPVITRPSKSISSSTSRVSLSSLSPSLKASTSLSLSPSASASISKSISRSSSLSPSLLKSPSVSVSKSPSIYPSLSLSPSVSISRSVLISKSPLISIYPSISPSPSRSLSRYSKITVPYYSSSRSGNFSVFSKSRSKSKGKTKRSKRRMQLVPLADWLSKSQTELWTGRPATQLANVKSTRAAYKKTILSGGLRFPTAEMKRGKVPYFTKLPKSMKMKGLKMRIF